MHGGADVSKELGGKHPKLEPKRVRPWVAWVQLKSASRRRTLLRARGGTFGVIKMVSVKDGCGLTSEALDYPSPQPAEPREAPPGGAHQRDEQPHHLLRKERVGTLCIIVFMVAGTCCRVHTSPGGQRTREGNARHTRPVAALCRERSRCYTALHLSVLMVDVITPSGPALRGRRMAALLLSRAPPKIGFECDQGWQGEGRHHRDLEEGDQERVGALQRRHANRLARLVVQRRLAPCSRTRRFRGLSVHESCHSSEGGCGTGEDGEEVLGELDGILLSHGGGFPYSVSLEEREARPRVRFSRVVWVQVMRFDGQI